MDLSGDLHRRIVARQMRSSLLRYMRSDRFRPEGSVSLAQLTNLFRRDLKKEER
jgi:hypothetical protein